VAEDPIRYQRAKEQGWQRYQFRTVRYDLEGLTGQPGVSSVRQSKGRLRTFAGKYVRWGGVFEIIGLATTGPPPKEVPHSDDQDGDTGDTTNYTTNDCADRSRICSQNENTTRCHGGRGHAACGVDSRTTSTCSGSDEEEVENESVGLVGRRHREVNLMSAVC
jgi:hypothetical protein